MKKMPRTLFGRTVLLLGGFLLASQAAAFVVNFFDRGSSLYRLNADQMAQRIGRTAQLLNRLPRDERGVVIQELGGRDFRIELTSRPIEIEGGLVELDAYEQSFSASIRDQMTPALLNRVEITRAPRAESPDEVAPPSANAFEQWLARKFYFLLPATFSVVTQIELEDGSTAAFFVRMPQEPLSQLEALIPKLLMWMAIVFALAAFVVRMMTNPLRDLSRAVTHIGENPTGSGPGEGAAIIPETGPVELQQVIRRFNETQERIRRYMIERSSLLAAISHDLRTPITRMRLRAEMLQEPQRGKFIHDLKEMEDLVGSSLDLFSELGRQSGRQPVDVAALLESITNDWTDTGHTVTLSGATRAVYSTEPSMLRRAVNNLVSNAIRYGGQAHIELIDTPAALTIAVQDNGPGIDEADLDRVLEPFVRLEPSRNRSSGGTGIGLAITRNIARWHGGDLKLANAPGRTGLVAAITLPRQRQRGDGFPSVPAQPADGEAAHAGPATVTGAAQAGPSKAGVAAGPVSSGSPDRSTSALPARVSTAPPAPRAAHSVPQEKPDDPDK